MRRAPLAAAAALGVLAGGAAFLAFAISRPTTPDAVAPTAPQEIVTTAAAPIAATPIEPETAPAAMAADDAASDGAGDAPFIPRLKPTAVQVATPIAPAASNAGAILTFSSAWLAEESDRPPPFFFQSDLAPDQAAIARHGLENGDIASAPHEARIVLAKGETFVDALRRAGVRTQDRNEAAYAFGKLYNMRRLRPGQDFSLTIAEPNRTLFQAIAEKEPPPAFLLSLEFRVDPERRILLAKAPGGGFTANEIATPLTTRFAAIEGRIDGSLYVSAKRQGAPDEVIAGLAQMFAYDVDFQREIFGGDEFEAIFEVRFDDAGNMVGGGDILYGRLKWRGRQKEKGYYRFETADGGGKADYFDASGESARRLLMKTPIDGARLSSGFGTRRHPILGYQKAHKGVDFAAARGTPIMAAGDGVIERAGPYGSFGNYVRIRHAQGYKTAYAHMNSIKKGVRTGVRVRQGEVIGYVGTTGRSTGPHLHYEVHLKDVAVNPQSLKIATGINLGGKELARFREIRDEIDAMRTAVAAEEPSLVADAKAKKNAL
ncbi:MAG: hypothetical protein A3E78_13520 [Alphaproteobacteria bacterium RIFCSPHIGHO2_12_FULL_63_12]|nr:MAG: hypothetical protein A3E78_13520 [Alphaproteobacteria bacterium RIFCSPHIGHO2_12_FULL_63_12]